MPELTCQWNTRAYVLWTGTGRSFGKRPARYSIYLYSVRVRTRNLQWRSVTSPACGGGRSLPAMRSIVRCDRVGAASAISMSVFAETPPPQPSQSELRSSRPRKRERERTAHPEAKHLKACQVLLTKIFFFTEFRICGINHLSWPRRGRLANRHGSWLGMRWTRTALHDLVRRCKTFPGGSDGAHTLASRKSRGRPRQ